MSAPWRLVADGERPGAMNMALDRAILSCRVDGLVPPTLRLYHWQLPTVTLGRFQRLDAVDVDACRRRGFDLVRRPTGGRGVLHDDELTYSVVAGVADGVPRGTSASYRHLCAGLARAYDALGVSAELTARPRGTRDAAACYLHATAADLSLGSAKLSGSAQVWSGDVVLQHGSFVISRDCAAEAEVFRLDEGEAIALDRSTATLDSALGRRPSLSQIAGAVVEGMTAALGVDLVPGELTDEELARAARWVPEHDLLPRCGVAPVVP